MSWELSHPWHRAPAPGIDPVVRANKYLRWVRQRSPQADWIALTMATDQHLAVLTAIGAGIHHLNQPLRDILQDLLTGLRPEDRPSVQIVAAPVALKVGIDGFCNLHTQPVTLVVDPSRIAPADWPHLVVHELAHAAAQETGHGPRFLRVLTALCLAQDLPPPPSDSLQRGVLPYWPPCQPNPQADQFWATGLWARG
jgi:hypothetical protein